MKGIVEWKVMMMTTTLGFKGHKLKGLQRKGLRKGVEEGDSKVTRDMPDDDLIQDFDDDE